jgi:hypothetical protein
VRVARGHISKESQIMKATPYKNSGVQTGTVSNGSH